MKFALWATVFLALLGACDSDPGASPHTLPGDDLIVIDNGKGDESTPVRVRSATTRAQIPQKPAAMSYQIHLIDVGTGLAMLVRGSDFTMLFDAGSGDPSEQSSITSKNRAVAYLFSALGASGPADCAPEGESAFAGYDGRGLVTIDHVVMSHAHLDHGSMLADVLKCFNVKNVWEPGVVNPTTFYRKFLEAVAAEPNVRYHTASVPLPDRTIVVKPAAGTAQDATAEVKVVMPPSVRWELFDEGQVIRLGRNSDFTVLYVDGLVHGDMNENSIVLRVDLGSRSLLLVGDAESGPRLMPSNPPAGAEQELLMGARELLDVDFLQVGHHGSLTSSRSAFLDAVSPRIALVGAGPRLYAGVKLPDAPVIDALGSMNAKIFRTDTFDTQSCPTVDRVGRDESMRPGGCANFIFEFSDRRSPTARTFTPNVQQRSAVGCDTEDRARHCRVSEDCVGLGDCCNDACVACPTLSWCVNAIEDDAFSH